MPKVTELLHEKGINKKKVESVIEDIKKYSSIASAEKPAFETEQVQRDYVKSLVQSGIDLINRRCKVKILLDKTNLNTKIRIPKGVLTNEHEISVQEALMFLAFYNEYIDVIEALSIKEGEKRAVRFPASSDGTKVISIQLYDEMWKQNMKKDLVMKKNTIDVQKDMLNVTTDIIE